MTPGTRGPTKYIRRGEEGVRASDLGPSENQAIEKRAPEPFQTKLIQIGFCLHRTILEPFWNRSKQIPNWCCEKASPILVLFGSVPDQFQNGPV